MSNNRRQQIQQIIAKNKRKTNTSKSPPLSHAISTNSLQIKSSCSPGHPIDITSRYQELIAKYKQLAQDFKDRNHEYELQSFQLNRLKLERERDHKQLYRLRSMIGFIKKQDKGIQTNLDIQSGLSWNTKAERSTAIQYQPDPETFYYTPAKLMGQKHASQKSEKIMKNYSQYQKSVNVNYTTPTSYLDRKEKDFENSYGKSQSIQSRKASQKYLKTVYKQKQLMQSASKEKQQKSKVYKLSNSPYSKLKFSRNL